MTQTEIEQAVESIWTLFRETDRRLDRRFEATERKIAALSAQTRAAENLFAGSGDGCSRPHYGRESLSCFRPGGSRSTEAWSGHGHAAGEIVVEVKSTPLVDGVRALLKDLERFPGLFPEYRSYRRFGAVAALAVNESADRYAYRQGLFVLTLGREGLVTLRNDDAFRLKDFAAGPVVPGFD